MRALAVYPDKHTTRIIEVDEPPAPKGHEVLVHVGGLDLEHDPGASQ